MYALSSLLVPLTLPPTPLSLLFHTYDAQQLGGAAFVGVVILVLAIPLQFQFVMRAGKLMRKAAGQTDERTKLVREVMGAMSVIKMYAWEESFQDKIRSTRGAELDWLLRSAKLRAANYFFISAIPIMVSVGSFAVFTILNPGQLNATRAFTSIALFNVLRMPLFMLPNIITQLTKAGVSLSRVRDVLQAHEQDLPVYGRPAPKGQTAIEVNPKAQVRERERY